jgi:hypothetical protein
MRSLLRVGVAAVCFSLLPIWSIAQSDKANPHGSAFKLFGNAKMTNDPENRENIVLRVVSDGITAAGAYRDLRHVKIWHLDHQLNFHRAVGAPHTCGGGSPRIQLLIDANGNGKFDTAEGDFVAHGHVRPPFAGCEATMPTGSPNGPSLSTLTWRFEDLTDEQPRWEVTGNNPFGFPPIGGAGGPNWDALEAAVSAMFPHHQVLRAIFLEDFNPTPPGTSYYDLITVLELTLGTQGQEKAPNPGRGRDRDDDDDDD